MAAIFRGARFSVPPWASAHGLDGNPELRSGGPGMLGPYAVPLWRRGIAGELKLAAAR